MDRRLFGTKNYRSRGACRLGCRESGATIVEFSLVIVVLAISIFAIIGAGTFGYNKVRLCQSTAEGANQVAQFLKEHKNFELVRTRAVAQSTDFAISSGLLKPESSGGALFEPDPLVYGNINGTLGVSYIVPLWPGQSAYVGEIVRGDQGGSIGTSNGGYQLTDSYGRTVRIDENSPLEINEIETATQAELDGGSAPEYPGYTNYLDYMRQVWTRLPVKVIARGQMNLLGISLPMSCVSYVSQELPVTGETTGSTTTTTTPGGGGGGGGSGGGVGAPTTTVPGILPGQPGYLRTGCPIDPSDGMSAEENWLVNEEIACTGGNSVYIAATDEIKSGNIVTCMSWDPLTCECVCDASLQRAGRFWRGIPPMCCPADPGGQFRGPPPPPPTVTVPPPPPPSPQSVSCEPPKMQCGLDCVDAGAKPYCFSSWNASTCSWEAPPGAPNPSACPVGECWDDVACKCAPCANGGAGGGDGGAQSGSGSGSSGGAVTGIDCPSGEIQCGDHCIPTPAKGYCRQGWNPTSCAFENPNPDPKTECTAQPNMCWNESACSCEPCPPTTPGTPPAGTSGTIVPTNCLPSADPNMANCAVASDCLAGGGTTMPGPDGTTLCRCDSGWTSGTCNGGSSSGCQMSVGGAPGAGTCQTTDGCMAAGGIPSGGTPGSVNCMCSGGKIWVNGICD